MGRVGCYQILHLTIRHIKYSGRALMVPLMFLKVHGHDRITNTLKWFSIICVWVFLCQPVHYLRIVWHWFSIFMQRENVDCAWKMYWFSLIIVQNVVKCYTVIDSRNIVIQNNDIDYCSTVLAMLLTLWGSKDSLRWVRRRKVTARYQ